MVETTICIIMLESNKVDVLAQAAHNNRLLADRGGAAAIIRLGACLKYCAWMIFCAENPRGRRNGSLAGLSGGWYSG